MLGIPSIKANCFPVIGYRGIEGRVSVYDIQATILHLLGFDHEQFTYDFQGRPFRLTDVEGQVIRQILA